MKRSITRPIPVHFTEKERILLELAATATNRSCSSLMRDIFIEYALKNEKIIQEQLNHPGLFDFRNKVRQVHVELDSIYKNCDFTVSEIKEINGIISLLNNTVENFIKLKNTTASTK
jgi:hypothetical protein